MAGRPMKYVTSKPSKGLRRGNVGMRSIIATSADPIGPTSATGYFNAINPTETNNIYIILLFKYHIKYLMNIIYREKLYIFN